MSKATLENYVLDDKCLTILDSALQAFSAYGFKKTSMDDIAKGAGMSRPALYLHFQNKEAILRQLTHLHYARKTAAVAEALNMEGSVSQIIGNAIHVQSDDMAEIMSSPHGLELLDAGVSTAADIVTQGEAQLMALYADWLRREAERGRVRLFDGPRETAKMIASALRGIKTSASDYQEFIRSNSNLATVIGAGIEVT